MRLLRQFETLCFLLQKDFALTESTKSTNGRKTLGQKHKSANKQISDYFSP